MHYSEYGQGSLRAGCSIKLIAFNLEGELSIVLCNLTKNSHQIRTPFDSWRINLVNPNVRQRGKLRLVFWLFTGFALFVNWALMVRDVLNTD